jgi:hypothetical protein
MDRLIHSPTFAGGTLDRNAGNISVIEKRAADGVRDVRIDETVFNRRGR